MTGQQLKNSILQWAIQGKLVPQDPTDEPASKLLERIRTEKAQLIKEGKLKKDQPTSHIYRDDEGSYYEKVGSKDPVCINHEILFDLPSGWEWCRGKTLFIPMQNTTPEGEIIYVDINSVSNKTNSIESPKMISAKDAPSRARRKLHVNDILFSMVRPYLRNIALVEEPYGDAIASTGFYVITPSVALFPRFVFYMVLSPYVIDGLNYYMKGENSPSINNGHVEGFLYPLPPLEEQKRIVARIEELMPLVEQYDKAHSELTRLNDQLPEQLKKSILQEAIQGKLVPQDPTAEPASVLLERIRTEKAQLIKEGKIKKGQPTSHIYRDDEGSYYEKVGSKDPVCINHEIPFDLPPSWEWCRLGSIIDLLSGRDLTPQDYNNSECGIPYITGASNFNNEKLIINRWTPSPVTVSNYGDLLITCKGTIGAMAFNTVGDIHIARQVMALSTIIEVNILYVKQFLESYVSNLANKARSIIPGISREDLLSSLFPLPPLEEQKRIVARIEELMPRIDKLR